jgi:RHS repeat-associated protein
MWYTLDCLAAARTGFIHADHLGSTSLTTDITGTLVAETRYLPYGEERWITGTLVTDFTFTGQRAEAGFRLMDYNARYYDPWLGRWLSPDPIVPDPTNPQSLNRYSYVYNRPLVYIDDGGNFPFIPFLVVLGAVALLSTASNPLPPDQQPPDWVGLLGLGMLFGGGAWAAAPDLAGIGATAACADGNCTNEAESVARTVCADGDCTNEAQAASRALNAACADGDCGNEVQQLGRLRSVGQKVWESTTGLRYGADPRFGNRVQHVLQHATNDPNRPGFHGVFDAGKSGTLGVIDEAWMLAQQGGSGVTVVQQGARTIYTVDMGRQIGYIGGQAGAALGNPVTDYVQLVIEGTNNIITAFPIIP